jgi:DNA-binding response OmpR family regulator
VRDAHDLLAGGDEDHFVSADGKSHRRQFFNDVYSVFREKCMHTACYIRCDEAYSQLQPVLETAGFVCERFVNETSLLLTLRRQSFDLILVDTESLDEKSFYSWLGCRTGETAPLVLLSPASSGSQIALALDAGADDFIRRPIDPVELIARLHAVLRRYHKTTVRSTVELLGFALDRGACRLLDRGVPVDLTPREFAMAWLFFSSPGVYLSRETISAMIWGVESGIANRTIEQHVYMLRKKLSLCAERGVRIRAAYTKGYRLELVDDVALGADPMPRATTSDAGLEDGLLLATA